MNKRLQNAAIVLGAVLAMSGVASPASATSDESVGYGFGHPIVVDRDFKVVDIDRDGHWDWLNYSQDNTHLDDKPPIDRPDSIAAPRLEWDLTAAEIEAMRTSRVILDIESSKANHTHPITLNVGGMVVEGMTGNSNQRFGPVGTDITAAVRSWISSGAAGPLTIDVTQSSHSILALEFEGSEWNEVSPATIFLLEPTSEMASEVRLRGYSGEWRSDRYSSQGGRPVWETVPSGAERNALTSASKIEFRVRVTECPAGASGNHLAISFSYHNEAGRLDSGRQDTQTVATGIEGTALEGGYLYVDVTDYVKANLERAHAFQIELTMADDAGATCKLAMNEVGSMPWYPDYSNVLAVNGDRPAPLGFDWQDGQLGTCEVSRESYGASLVSTTTVTDDVETHVVARDVGEMTAERDVADRAGSVLDFSVGTSAINHEIRYRATFTRGSESEVVICGRVVAPSALTTEVLEAAQENVARRLEERIAAGQSYGGWIYFDFGLRKRVNVVVDLNDPGVIVASSLELSEDSIDNPFTAHADGLANFDRIADVDMDFDGLMHRIAYEDGTGVWAVASRSVAYGSTIDEVMEGLRTSPYRYIRPWKRVN